MNKQICHILFAGLLLFFSCERKEEYCTPKPKGYFRIDLPEHQYQLWDSILPFHFEYSQWANCAYEKKGKGVYWLDIHYPVFNASFNITCLPLKNDLRDLAASEEKILNMHIEYGKVDDIEYYFIEDSKNRVYGRIYDIIGKEAASPMQFWITDSTNYYIRASLYFDFTPNNDSLQPVIQYLREDAMHLINSLNWRF
jgi:gliding motility-associated lipoprotein GldD